MRSKKMTDGEKVTVGKGKLRNKNIEKKIQDRNGTKREIKIEKKGKNGMERDEKNWEGEGT